MDRHPRRRPALARSVHLAAARGFTLIELMAVVAVIAILATIAVPNVQNGLRKSRRTNAYTSIKVLEKAIQTHMLDRDGPPTTLNATSLEPLVSRGYVTAKQRRAILGALHQNRLIWYFGWTGAPPWGYDYGVCFIPKKDNPTTTTCYLYPEGMFRWENGVGWEQVM